MPTVLLAGDRFVTPDLFRSALDAALQPRQLIPTYREWSSAWPDDPFRDVDGVKEASGTASETIEHLGDAEVALTQLAPFTAEVFAARPTLRMIGVCRGGPVNVDLTAATDAGVVVTFAPGRNAQAAAEFTIGLILAAMRRIPESDAELRDGVWRGDNYALDRVGTELGAATVGLVGYGAIGRIVARILSGFGARVLAYDPYSDPAALAVEGVDAVRLDDLLAVSDVVSLHARYSPETHHLIDEAALRRMKPGAVLVNGARGGLLDYDPLPGLLESGHLGAVAVDVYDIEPPPADHPLLHAPNVVLSPHLAGATRQTAERAARIVAADAARFLRGEPPQHVANRDVLSVRG